MLETAKNEAAELLRTRHGSRMRKSSMELYEALNCDEDMDESRESMVSNKAKRARKTLIRFARIQRYNRILKARVAKHGAILEHELLNEYLNIVKNNYTEKGKYNVLDEKYFIVKRHEEIFKSLFYQMRQIADRQTIRLLANNLGKMEKLRDQIDELMELKNSGITDLKGRRLKIETTPWSCKKRKPKKENYEQKKANLRWKRIKRWTKKNHQNSEIEEENS